jgi:hypothetical protein
MPILSADLKRYKAANHPSNDTGTVGGAIDAASEITAGSVGEIVPSGSMLAQDVDGVQELFYYKSFFKNIHGSLSLLGAKLWLVNALDQLSAASTIKLLSNSASDGSSKKARIYGKNNANGVIETEDVTLNGVTSVTSTKTFLEIYRVSLLLVSDGSITTAVGDIEVRRNTDNVLLGIIPGSGFSGLGTGYSWATTEIDIGLAATVNDSLTSANRKTAPAGITFSRPRTEAAALTIPGADLAAGAAIGVWQRYTLKPGMLPPPSTGVWEIPRFKGTTIS